MRQEFLENFEKLNSPKETFDKLIGFIELQSLYDYALDEITTKLDILDKEFELKHMYNPIHHTEHRVKDTRSLAKKMHHKECEMTAVAARKNILDIAGVRVICNYIHDIYTIEKLLSQQEDIQSIKRKDYIETP